MLTPSTDLPDCVYKREPTIIQPIRPTPNHLLYLSNLDDQKFLRFSIKYLYLFRKSVNIEKLKESLSRVLVEYYPLAGRLRRSEKDDDHKLEVKCNGEGAVFAEAVMNLSADEFVEFGRKPNKSLRKLLYRVEGSPSFLDTPPLVVQITNLPCGGMILCLAINHCICDGIGTSEFLHAWAYMTNQSTPIPPIQPFHSREVLRPRNSPQVTYTHPGFTQDNNNSHSGPNIFKFLISQPLVTASMTFSSSQIFDLKRQSVPSLKCTNFEVLASHTWRCWVKSLDLPSSLKVKLLFSVNIRKKLSLPGGYYGNGFVLACAETECEELIQPNLHDGVRLVQEAKSNITEDYVKSTIDFLEDKNIRTDLSTSLVISQWSNLGLEDLDFGEGKPLHMGPLTSDIYCLLLPVNGDVGATRVLISMPECVIEKFQYYMTEFSGTTENGNGKNFGGVENLELVSV